MNNKKEILKYINKPYKCAGLYFSIRTYNALKLFFWLRYDLNIYNVSLEHFKYISRQDILKTRNFGKCSLNELEKTLNQKFIKLKP